MNKKPWKPVLYVVEIWWEHEFGEWLFDSAFVMKKEALKKVKEMRSTGYKFRIVKYTRA